MSVSTADVAAPVNSPIANTLTMDRRREDRRGGANCDSSKAPATSRRKNQRRRHIDPTTCERDYSAGEVEFMKAMDEYKQSSGRMFPTCSEVLEVLHGLGYVQLNDEQFAQLGLDEVAAGGETIADDLDSDWQE
ncbi:hypothetical protein [Allorhodopirellula heiligendammensis]|uniref:Uncharacterized protein n=1 Tax=Allorhodopirellula heiligendammensis TaxID=2714739 RepID=A0A5C6BWY0_9BACT|nr:hypothetical protein [Allorhodopirellula heiligendammensis]TWU16475.1 hypothetical protein Poly21_36800 [Allorhodopirellula heiligendammensis]